MDKKPGNRFMMTAIFIKGLRILKRIQDVAYATISTKALEITQLQQATIKVFLNQLGNCATLSAENRRFL